MKSYGNQRSSPSMQIYASLNYDSLSEAWDRAKLVSKNPIQRDRFTFDGESWEIISLGTNGIYARKIDGEERFLGYQYCSKDFIYIKHIQ